MIEEFSQIVGLVSAFAAGRDGEKLKQLAEFQQWLIEHNHNEISQRISENSSTSTFVKAFLNRELPQIQSKLDILTAMVQVLIEKQDGTEESKPANIHYAKNVFRLILQQAISENYSITEFEYVNAEIESFLHSEGIHYNSYVLKHIIRECLEFKETAYTSVEKHWLELTM
ncbi:hypothetical protein [Cellvibrio sp. pealriver]|uniref:hypothetical protein n=1 Tax=Cellvibrio sp. pealriver TaxID=1622269 RepID=UPI00066FECFB|nr:hypothetical protein [Cellvibrio sp. pealriver]